MAVVVRVVEIHLDPVVVVMVLLDVVGGVFAFVFALYLKYLPCESLSPTPLILSL